MQEEWRPVVGYEGIYEVSNLGRVKRILCGRGTKGGILSQGVRKCLYGTGTTRYNHVVLSYMGKTETKTVHRLVAEAFIPNPDGKRTVNHKDGDGENNIVSNLEWATQSEQELHKWHILGHKIMSDKFGYKSTRVRCVDTGEVFDSIRLACLAKNVDRGCLGRCLSGKQSSTKGLHWERA